VPRLGPDEHFRSYKISKRYDQDISSVLGAFWFHTVGGRIVAARMAWGGMAATPRRSPRTEEVVIGLSLDDQGPSPDAEEALRAALARDFTPIDDHRASARYRQRVAGALVLKALREIAGRPSGETRVRGHRQDAA
ncbi:MAG: xanthine dehydrogenase small subunit, partial [Acidobacteria bacterium]|nr:xanthine dehydrogenase small subunit [Acidobacteriota bacterium]